MLNTKQLWGTAEEQKWKGNSRSSTIRSLHDAGEIPNLLFSMLFFFLSIAQTGLFFSSRQAEVGQENNSTNHLMQVNRRKETAAFLRKKKMGLEEEDAGEQPSLLRRWEHQKYRAF